LERPSEAVPARFLTPFGKGWESTERLQESSTGFTRQGLAHRRYLSRLPHS
jgi:hypothetical protein